MANNDFENSIKNALKTLADKMADASGLEVTTKYVEIGNAGADFSQALPVAQTKIALDGDYEATIPMRKNPAGQLEIDNDLFDRHQENVTTAMEYRAHLLETLANVIQALAAS